MKKVLITGAGSYIGNNIREYLEREPEKYSVSVKDAIGWEPEVKDFAGIDVVINVAGITHVKENSKNRQLFFDINRDLAIKIAKKAKTAAVKQFIQFSTMSVYGKTCGHITKTTPVSPKDAYGKSKAQVDAVIEKLADDGFRFVCLRPPMVYGKACKGNYTRLRSFALKFPVFPKYSNQRSMIYVGNLCEFVKECIDECKAGLFFPQNAEYVNPTEMVKEIAGIHNKKIRLTRAFNWAIKIMPFKVFKKVFGTLTYEPVDTVAKYGFRESIDLTE